MDKKAETVEIPKWFVNTASFVMVCAIPWAYTISLKLNTLSVKMESSLEVKKKFEIHLEHHISRSEIQELKRRIEKLEK